MHIQKVLDGISRIERTFASNIIPMTISVRTLVDAAGPLRYILTFCLYIGQARCAQQRAILANTPYDSGTYVDVSATNGDTIALIEQAETQIAYLFLEWEL